MERTAAQTLVDVLRARACSESDRTAFTFLVDGEAEAASLSFSALDLQARAIAALLQAHRAQGERVVLCHPPGLEFIAALYGCLYAGAVAVPAYPPRNRRAVERLAPMVCDAQPRLALTTASLRPLLERQCAQSGLPEAAAPRWLATDGRLEHPDPDWRPPVLRPDSLAVLQYTSGSTSTPRGVMLTHENLAAQAEFLRRHLETSARSVLVAWLPPFHDMGLLACVLQPVYVGFPAVHLSPAHFVHRPIRWLRALSRYRATLTGGPDFAYRLCVERTSPEERDGLDLRSLELAASGAEPVRAETMERFAATFAPYGFRSEAFYPTYGLAEATLQVSGGPKLAGPLVYDADAEALEQGRLVEAPPGGAGRRRLVGCGRFEAGQVAIVDPDTLDERAQAELGEIWVAGGSVAAGYWRRPEETAATFRAYLRDGRGPYLRTGDLGFVHRGQLFIAGRIKDLVIVHGRNLFPQDLEWTARASHPALGAGAGAAFSVEAEGEERLVIVHEVDHRATDDLAEVARAIRQAVLRDHEVPVHAVVLLRHGDLPRTTSGKVQRRQCRARYLAGALTSSLSGGAALDRS